ncbi:hypothetical protein JOQ06_009779 [Pogonophryne albipinna]|uniref:Uncharacterized protein n=1 Tax=Pogonophryne albipinna TaxID=1090488 RepID=A0AAD6FTJ5_9TELE|nr:hypothetical protein JOQ06_009779 [Pogonophryne albipinna]
MIPPLRGPRGLWEGGEGGEGGQFYIKLSFLESHKCCLSSQLLPWHPASAPPGQAKPQLSHMPCLLDV